MAFKHGKDTAVLIDANDISEFTDSTVFTDTTELADVTAYGRAAHNFLGGLTTGTITIGGNYDDGALGPRAVLQAIKDAGLRVPFIYQPEGTGAGLPQDSVNVFVMNYVETAPVADKITWTSELQMTDTIDHTVQI